MKYILFLNCNLYMMNVVVVVQGLTVLLLKTYTNIYFNMTRIGR